MCISRGVKSPDLFGMEATCCRQIAEENGKKLVAERGGEGPK